MDSPTATLIQILRERVDSLVSQGDYNEAVHAANAAVDQAQQVLTADLGSIDEFVDALEVRGELFRSIGRYQEALDDYGQALDQLENRPDRMMQEGRLYAGSGAVHDSLESTGEAMEFWEKAMLTFEEGDPPALLDVAAMANNLAYLKKSGGDIDGAEVYFLKALEILHRELGQDHEETAIVSNNIGALYQASGHHEQAREMHMMALETRQKFFGDKHPDTAQSHNNLALALMETGDRAWARRHFDKALSAFESLGGEYFGELEKVASNFCDFLRVEGDPDAAKRVEMRVDKVAGR